MPSTGTHRGGLVYHWKHGWIPRDHFAALQKAHGSKTGAAKIEKQHGVDAPSRYSDMSISELIQRRNAGDGEAGKALARGDHKKPAPIPASVPKPVSDKPGAPGVMTKAAYDEYRGKVDAARREHQPKADAVAKTLPEPQARALLAKYTAVMDGVAVRDYERQPYPSESDIRTYGQALATTKALRDRLAIFSTQRQARAGKQSATEAQVAFIHRLRAQRKQSGVGGGFMHYTGDPAKLSRADASALIDSLRGTY